MPRVAVVVPCYNDGATLLQTLESLRMQEPHDLVVVDDGSTEERTLQVLAELERDGLRVVHQPNAGLSCARMAGVAATSAPYVLPLDADDALAPGAVQALADALDGDSGAAMAWGDVEIWGEIELKVRIGHHLDPWLITYLNTLPVASLVRRDALLEAGGWQLRHGYEDWDLWMSFAERGWTGIYTPHNTLRYRRRDGRMLADCLPRHNELVADLRSRHASLIARRRHEWLRSRAPFRAKLIFPIVESLPISDFEKARWFQFASHPLQVLRMRRLRGRAARLREATVAR